MGENYEQYILKHDASYVHLCKAIRLFHSINQLCCIMNLKIFCIQLIFILVTRISVSIKNLRSECPSDIQMFIIHQLIDGHLDISQTLKLFPFP